MTTFECHILRLALGGDGVGHRDDGKVVFIPDALPGERVRVEVVEARKRFIRARVVERLEASPARRPPDCVHETEHGCGGCGLRHVADAAALSLKAEAAHGELEKIARGVDWPRLVQHPSPTLDHTRGRIRFHVQEDRVGLYRKGSHEIIATPDCLAFSSGLMALAPELSWVIGGGPHPAALRAEAHDGACYIAWLGSSNRTQRKRMGTLLQQGLIAGARFQHHDRAAEVGRVWLEETQEIGGQTLTWARKIGAFAQANETVNRLLRERLHAHLEGGGCERVVELYAGSGNLTMVAALHASEVLAVEVVPDAIEGLKRSARASSLDARVTTHTRDLSQGLNPRLIEATRGSVLLLDPPREGAGKLLMAQLAQAAPARIIYVSCDPATLARDVQALTDDYRVSHLEAFDMFPRTPHVELLAVLERVDAA